MSFKDSNPVFSMSEAVIELETNKPKHIYIQTDYITLNELSKVAEKYNYNIASTRWLNVIELLAKE